MIIIRKISILSNLPIYTIPHLSSYFSTLVDRKKIARLKQLLQTSSKQMKSDYLIKSIHFLHFQSQKLQQTQQNIFSSIQLDDLVSTISKYMHNLTHKQLTLFLQTISDYDKYRIYSRSDEVSKLIVRRLNTIHMIEYEGEYIVRFLNVLQKMKFPSMFISKYVISVVEKLNGKGKFSKLNCIKFFIAILEMKFVHVSYVQKFYLSSIQNLKASDPKQISFLYYAIKIAKHSLAQKLKHFSEKSQIRDIVFNPYSQTQDAQTAEFSREQKKKREKQVRDHLQAFLNLLQKNINVISLQKDICKYFGYEKHPLKTPLAVILSSVQELRPTLTQFFKNNFKTMSYLEFGVLFKLLPENERAQYFNDYKGRAFQHMKFQEKLELLNIKSELVCPVSKQQLMSEIGKSISISTLEFNLITRIIVKDLGEKDQLQIIKAVEKVLNEGQGKSI